MQQQRDRLAMHHVCRICLRTRSHKFHREHPIPLDGVPPPPGICRRCRISSEVNNTVREVVAEDRVSDPILYTRLNVPTAHLESDQDFKRVPAQPSPVEAEDAYGDNTVEREPITERRVADTSNGQSFTNSKWTRSIHNSSEQDSHAISKTDRLYLEGRGECLEADHVEPETQVLLAETSVRKIAREEICRYRRAEHLLKSHPHPYSYGRMIPIERIGHYASKHRGDTWENGFRLQGDHVSEMKSDPDRNDKVQSAENLIVTQEKKITSVSMGHSNDSTPGNGPSALDGDPVPVSRGRIVVKRAGSDSKNCCRNPSSALQADIRRNNRDGRQLMEVSSSQTFSGIASTEIPSVHQYSDQDGYDHRISPPYPTSDRDHLSPPSPSRSRLQNFTSDSSDVATEDDKTIWPVIPCNSQPPPTAAYGASDYEYLYIERTARACSPPRSSISHVHFGPSPERPSSSRRVPESSNQYKTANRPSPDCFVYDSRERSSTFNDKLSRMRYPTHSHRDTPCRTLGEQSVERSCSSKRKDHSAHLEVDEEDVLAEADHVEASDHAGHGPYRESETATGSMSAQGGSPRDWNERQGDSVRLSRRGLSVIRMEY